MHSAICTITGTPDALSVNLACTSTSESHVPQLMQYVNDHLLPTMEKSLGIQFEVRNLRFAVAGLEHLGTSPEPLHTSDQSADWLDRPFAPPIQQLSEAGV